MPAFMEELHGLLAGLNARTETLEADVRDLEEIHGVAVYDELVYLLSRLRFPAGEAKRHWERLLAHRQSMESEMAAPVDLRVALVSYFLEINHQLEEPKVVEIQLHERVRPARHRDELTGLCNADLFHEHLVHEVFSSERSGRPLSLVVIDVDDFELYCKHNGAKAGSEILAAVASVLTATLRKSDIAGRYRDEEFALILPNTPKTSAEILAERMRQSIEQKRSAGTEFLPAKRLTVSMGVATYPADATDAVELVRHADRALYVAKSEGKNQVVLYGQSRRSFERASVNLSGSFRLLGQEVFALTTVNVSAAGVLFRTSTPVQVGDLVEVTLKVDAARELAACGRIVHSDAKSDGSHMAAMQITYAGSADRVCLAQLVREVADRDMRALPPTPA
jgi:diguanylate cyclase (GGDEF)-like protein